MSNINRFPIELLALIFADVRESEQADAHGGCLQYRDASTCPLALAGVCECEHVGSFRACFPFNIASTCPFWMEILISNPVNWQSIVIDVADDPTPVSRYIFNVQRRANQGHGMFKHQEKKKGSRF